MLFLFVTTSLVANKNDSPIIDYSAISHPQIGSEGMVVSQRKIASEIGAQISLAIFL